MELNCASAPQSSTVNVVTLLIAPLKAPPERSFKVNALEPPVTVPIVRAAVLVSMVVALPSVTAPNTTASSDVTMVPFRVTVPSTLAVFNPPL